MDNKDIKVAKTNALMKLVEALREMEKEGWEGIKNGKTMVVVEEKKSDECDGENEENTTEENKSQQYRELKKK